MCMRVIEACIVNIFLRSPAVAQFKLAVCRLSPDAGTYDPESRAPDYALEPFLPPVRLRISAPADLEYNVAARPQYPHDFSQNFCPFPVVGREWRAQDVGHIYFGGGIITQWKATMLAIGISVNEPDPLPGSLSLSSPDNLRHGAEDHRRIFLVHSRRVAVPVGCFYAQVGTGERHCPMQGSRGLAKPDFHIQTGPDTEATALRQGQARTQYVSPPATSSPRIREFISWGSYYWWDWRR